MAGRLHTKFVILAFIFCSAFLVLFFRTTIQDRASKVLPLSLGGKVQSSWELDDLDLDSPTRKKFPHPTYRPGNFSDNTKISRTVVFGSLKKENTSWITEFDDDPTIKFAIYDVDEPQEPYVVPENKGHELMIYLSYLIDFYHDLDDVTIFLHAHERTWHNNDLLEKSQVPQLKNLKMRPVIERGYVNLRCRWDPGCPSHIPSNAADPTDDSEMAILKSLAFGHAWQQILPNHAVPKEVGGTCCAQFAVSRERLHALPKQQYIHFRNWLLRTRLASTGRLWEYIWQYVFTGDAVVCPTERECYCDIYGICTDNNVELYELRDAHRRVVLLQRQIEGLEDGTEKSPDPERELELIKKQLGPAKKEWHKLLDQALSKGWDKEEEEERRNQRRDLSWFGA